MKRLISHNIRLSALSLLGEGSKKSLLDNYGMNSKDGEDHLFTITDTSLGRLPKDLVKDSGIKNVGFEDMGESKEFYPNHGYYVNNLLVLNSQLINDPYSYKDHSGRTMNKFDQTLYHELGHGWDDVMGLLSEQKEWLDLSGWSEEWKPGLKRVIITEEGQPEVRGEWCYNPDSGFTRFYAKRNPWDDFADTFAYYVAGMKSFLPGNKIEYFDRHLGRYYRG